MNGLVKTLGLAPAHPYRALNLWFLLITLGGLAFAIALQTIGVSGTIVALLWVAAVACAITLVVLVLSGQGYTRDMDRIQAGDYLEKWTYTPGEWARFAGAEARRLARGAYSALRAGVVIAVVLSAITAGTEHSLPSSVPALIAAVLVLLIAALAALGMYMHSQTIAADASDKNRTIYIGHRGVLKPWGYEPVIGPNLRFAGASVDQGSNPPELVLTSITYSRYSSRHVSVRVPIPQGQEKEVPRLAGHLTGYARTSPLARATRARRS